MEIKKREDIPENRQVRLTVTVDRSTWQDALMHCYNGIKSLCPVEGEPTREKIEAAYGPDFLYQEAVNETYPQALVEAIGREDIAIAGTPTLTVESIGSDGFTFTALIDLYPEVKLGQYKGLSAVYPAAELSEEDTQAALEEYARAHMTVEHPDRAAMGDEVVLDFEGFVDGVPFEGGKGEGYPLLLGSGMFIPGFEEQIVGMKAGDERDVVVTFPENYVEALAGKEATFKVTVKSVKEPELPELDDELAKDISDYETIPEDRDHVREDLEKEFTEQQESDYATRLMKAAVDNMTVEIPEPMILAKLDEQLRNYISTMGISPELTREQVLASMGLDEKTFQEIMRPQAVFELQTDLLLDAIVKAENIELDEGELDETYNKMAEEYKMDVDKIKQYVDEKIIVLDMKRRKAAQLIRDTAVDKEPEAKEEAAETKEEAAE